MCDLFGQPFDFRFERFLRAFGVGSDLCFGVLNHLLGLLACLLHGLGSLVECLAASGFLFAEDVRPGLAEGLLILLNLCFGLGQ